jgi:hypothetical protein
MLLLALFLPATHARATAPLPAAQDTTRTIWMMATLDGRRVGYLHYQRNALPGRVVTRSVLDVQFARTGRPLHIRNSVTETETNDGQPLRFSASTDMSSQDTTVSGTRMSDSSFRITHRTGDHTRTSRLDLPAGTVLDNGMRMLLLAHGFAPGSIYVIRHFNTSTQAISNIHMHVVGTERVELPGGARMLHHLRQTTHGARESQIMDLWVDDDGNVLKNSTPMLGFTLELLACSKACAMQPVQSIDILRNTMVDVPMPLADYMRAKPLRFVFRVDAGTENPFINTDSQVVRKIGKRIWVVDVVNAAKRGKTAPRPTDTAANDWLQSDDPEIHQRAISVTREARNNSQRMHKLEAFVRTYMLKQGPSVGYASALEALHTRQGDCTEYAVLLAAMARSLGIPARVATGLVYSAHYSGRERVLVPHSWVQAWIGGVWKGYDAAQKGFDHTHLTMATGDGDPWRYFSGLSSLGHLDLLEVSPGSELLHFRAPSNPPTADTQQNLGSH